jgi:hypothetical protein
VLFIALCRTRSELKEEGGMAAESAGDGKGSTFKMTVPEMK